MANRFNNPDEQICDQTGTPYAGGFLHFYQSGTNTPLNTYSDSGLTIANLNPVVLDSAGRVGSVFLQNQAYKVVLEDVNHVQIWTEDPVWSSDYSTLAQVQPFSGNPNGQLAGTASTQGSMPGSSMVWDYVNNVLYVCTTTGTSVTSVWTAVNAAAAIPSTPAPTGYLTPTSGTPVVPTDVVAATAVYYTPYKGNVVPIYNGTSFTVQSYTELTLTLVAAHAASTLYDVFVFNNNGVLTLVTGPGWASSVGGSSSRGTGPGTTSISLVNGLWTNSVLMTGRNGNTVYTISANLATYLGTLFIDPTPGQVSCYRSWGQSRTWGVWNAYNRQSITLQCGDTTASWLYALAAIRASNGLSANSFSIATGLAEEMAYIEFTQTLDTTLAPGQIYIGVNSILAGTGKMGKAAASFSGASGNISSDAVAVYASPPALGLMVYTCLEASPGVVNVNFEGTNAHMVMTGTFQG